MEEVQLLDFPHSGMRRQTQQWRAQCRARVARRASALVWQQHHRGLAQASGLRQARRIMATQAELPSGEACKARQACRLSQQRHRHSSKTWLSLLCRGQPLEQDRLADAMSRAYAIPSRKKAPTRIASFSVVPIGCASSSSGQTRMHHQPLRDHRVCAMFPAHKELPGRRARTKDALSLHVPAAVAITSSGQTRRSKRLFAEQSAVVDCPVCRPLCGRMVPTRIESISLAQKGFATTSNGMVNHQGRWRPDLRAEFAEL
mmetsp:Transcript_144105/g.375267  ORF Transcript_144105/g.375267 Transcript_144105/m.375267 type:complete len:259 (+) Transcript_144105:2-778(+)